MTRRLRLLPDVSVGESGGVTFYLREDLLTESDRKEIEEQNRYSVDQPDLDLFAHTVAKSGFIAVFERLLPLFRVAGGERVLELGAGRAWASAMLKKAHSACYVVASDLSPVPVSHAGEYERLLGVELDERWAFSSSAIPFADEQFDIVFTFAAFHHMIIGGRYRQVLAEIVRILKPKGRALLLYEPGTPRYLYPLAYARVSKRPGVDEDLILLHCLRQLSRELNFDIRIERFPDPSGRSSAAALIYYSVLSKLPFLASLVPCTVNIVLQKNARGL